MWVMLLHDASNPKKTPDFPLAFGSKSRKDTKL